MTSFQYQQFKLHMQGSHEPHMAKPKIAKNASSKLPEAFRMQTATSKRPPQSVEQVKNSALEIKHEAKQLQKELIMKQKKNRNPFLPVKEFIKKAEEFTKQMREVNNEMQQLSNKYSLNVAQARPKGIKYKYQNCITLSVIRKNGNGCLKKVLHVPTLSVHFLKESLISSHIEKNQLLEWMSIINQEDNAVASCIRILQLFWSMPEHYYSLLYDYHEGLLLDSLTESLHTMPLPLLKQIGFVYFTAGVGILNAHLILNEQAGSKIIRYLPLYEENDFTIGESKQMREIMDSQLGNLQNQHELQIDRKCIWRLGVILLNGYLGSMILNMDVAKVQLPLKKCCLLHEILGSSGSLSSLFVSLNNIEDEPLLDFLCKCMRSRKFSEKEGQIEIKTLRSSKFLNKKYSEIISLGQMIQVVNPSSDSKSKFEISKMNRILDSVGLTLQNKTSALECNITPQSKGVIYLARELGMSKQIDKMVSELKKVYRLDKAT